MSNPNILTLKELIPWLKTVKNIHNVFVLSGDPDIGQQIILTPYGGEPNDFSDKSDKSEFNVTATIFAATQEDCYDLAETFRQSFLIAPSEDLSSYLTYKLHHIHGLDNVNEPYEDEINGESNGYWTTLNFRVLIKLYTG